MSWQQQTWYRAGSDILARAGFSLAMCGALAGILYATSHDGQQDTAASLGNPSQTATILASFENSPGLSKSQAVIDASPASPPATMRMPTQSIAELAPIPARRPLPPLKKKEPVAVAANVVRFESCLPGCESRDPLIVSSSAKAVAAEVSSRPTDELLQDASLTDTSPSILGRALDAPGAVYRTSRNALTTLVRAAL